MPAPPPPPPLPDKYIIGLTGGIGSGKSTAAEVFSAQGIQVVDADQAARRVVEPGSAALASIAQRFGASFLQPDGALNRAALRAEIFAHEAQRRWLEQLLHPLIGAELEKQLRAVSSPYGVLASPLLLETPQRLHTHRILVLDLPESLQVQRVMGRDGGSAEDVQAIIQTQWPRARRLAQADDVIRNVQDTDALARRVQQLHARYLALARRHGEGGGV